MSAVWATGSAAQEWVYTARPGDTLSGLAVEYLAPEYNATNLQAHNELANPDYLPTGTRLRVPVAWLKLQPTPATLVLVTGNVQRSRDDGQATKPLEVGVKLNAGDTLRTGSDGVATIEFADGSRLLLQPDSSVTLDTLSAMGTTGMVDTSMRLHGGRVENIVEPSENPNSRYRVVTPPAVAAVRGTEFRIGYETATELMTGEVADGTIGVSAQGVSREIPAGFGVVTQLGEPPGEPTALLPPPDVAQLPARVSQTQIAFSWPALTGAVAYRSEVFGGEQFQRLLRSVTLDTPDATFALLPLDRYLLQLRAIDAAGLAGANARHEFEVQQPPAAPVLLAPPDLSDWSESALTLRWSMPPGVQLFRLQLTRDPTFANLLVERTSLRDIELTLPDDLASGHYYWRVASVDPNGIQGPFAQPHEFTIHSLPTAPNVRVSALSAGKLDFAWSAVVDARGYRLLLARDARFNDIVLDIDTDATALRVASPPWGRYFVRVQSIGDSGRAGASSPVRALQVPLWLPAPQILLLLIPLLILLPLHLRLRRAF
ncbi:MAG: FecR domain-containing protein [Gammaproteobacteria bacterium]|nr:FecR domain-containing protein [Gammaproteobacteria bacterium]